MTTTDPKAAKATTHTEATAEAVERIRAALAAGRPVDLADAKVLEAAGCWLRRNMTEAS